MKLILVFISIVLDLLVVNFYRISSFNLNYFYPMFTISTISYLSLYYGNLNKKNYYLLVLVASIIYDSLAVNNLIITVFLFLIMGIFNMKAKTFLRDNFFCSLLKTLISILIFDMGFYIILVLFRYENLFLIKPIYKFTHSILINELYVFILFFVLKKRKA